MNDFSNEPKHKDSLWKILTFFLLTEHSGIESVSIHLMHNRKHNYKPLALVTNHLSGCYPAVFENVYLRFPKKVVGYYTLPSTESPWKCLHTAL